MQITAIMTAVAPTIRATAGAVLLLVSVPIDANAQKVATDCLVGKALVDVYYQTIKRGAELAEQQLPILERFNTLNEKAKDPKRPVGEQLSRSDVAEWGRLQQRMQTNHLYRLLESNLGRDVRAIDRMFAVANNMYVKRADPQKDSEDYRFFVELMRMTSLRDDLKGKITVPNDMSVCNVETALHLVEDKSIEKLNSLETGIKGGFSQLHAIMAKYRMTGRIDPAKLTPQDRALVDHIQRTVIAPGTWEQTFIMDMENLKDLWDVAHLRYEMNKRDVIDSVGDFDSVGKTFNALILPPRTRFFLGVLDKIAEKFPSDYSRQMQSISRAVDQLESSQKSKRAEPAPR
jgi:hypothetical protein